MILIVKHIDSEGPGTLEGYLQAKRYALKTVNLQHQESLPEEVSSLEAVVVLGGPMNVYEESQYPFLVAEDVFIKNVLQQEIPFLGICLGSQLLAKAAGARVEKSPVKEIGWHQAMLNKEAQRDPVFLGLPQTLDVFHWHEDMFQIPDGGVLLAAGRGCPHQALRVGRWAYGIQFHIEVDRPIIAEWCAGHLNSQNPAQIKQAQNMLDVYQWKEEGFLKQAHQIYHNFAALVEQRKKERLLKAAGI